MYSKDKNNGEENFWISYADLMAGLLFVFILVIGAIIIKYLYTQTDLKVMKVDLKKEKEALNLSEEELKEKREKLENLNIKLQRTKGENLKLSFELAKSQNSYKQTINDLEKSKELSKKLNNKLTENDKELQLSQEQIEKITAILNDKENQISLLSTSLDDHKKQVTNKLEAIKMNLEEIGKLKTLLLGLEIKIKDEKSKNKTLEVQNQALNEKNKSTNINLTEKENILKLKDDELILLQNKLIEQLKSHQSLVEEFDITKIKIKHLTGIKLTVIDRLRQKLGSSINIDKKSGAIKFSSNILFGQGEYEIKEESKEELKSILKKYMAALLEHEDIRKYIHYITIEGHTNSDGSYLSNLELSQRRALEVMKFLYESHIVERKLIRKYVNSSGRSYSDRILKNGLEDKDLSRRIEIKFSIKNEATIKELQNFLEEKNESRK